MSTTPHPTGAAQQPASRRMVMRGAAMAGLAAAAALGHETPAMAAGPTTAAFAPGPSGGDDTGLLKDAAMYGKILGPGPYRAKTGHLDLQGFTLIGIPGITTIQVDSESFIDCSAAFNSMHVSGISFECDPHATNNVIRNRSTGVDVSRHKVIRDCFFHNFRYAAISMNLSDSPYLKADNLIFYGAGDTTATGIATASGYDSSLISNCDFTEVAVGIEIGAGGNHMRVRDCEFVFDRSGSNRANVWVRPHTQLANSGQGMRISDTKFGSENRSATDFFILYADKAARVRPGAPGRWPGDFEMSLSTSRGYVSLHSVDHCDFSGSTPTLRSPISSWTPNTIGCQYGPNVHSGSPSKYELEYLCPAPTNFTGTRVDIGTDWGTHVVATNASSKAVQTIH